MAERMAFTLDGNDNLSPVFRRIGESAERFHQRINDAVDESGGELRAFTRGAGGQLQELGRNLNSAGQAADGLADDARGATPAVTQLGAAAEQANSEVARFTRDSNGRIRDLRGRFLSAAAAAHLLAREAAGAAVEIEDVGDASGRSAVQVRSLGNGADRARPSISRLGSAAGTASAELGSAGGGLGGALGVVAAIAGLSVLPALGALVPMVAGLGVAAGTMKLGFSGIGGALEAAGKGKKEYAAALKELTPEARAFTKELVSVKKEFEGLGDRIQKVMLPGFTDALKEAGPLTKILGASMTEMGKGFGDAARGAGRLMKDSGFQKDFTTVLRLGNVFVSDLTKGLGGLARGFLHFGAASEPTLRSLSSGISDLLGKGLPGMFQGLERGVGGSSKFLDGLFGMINNLLPALGRLSGEFGRTFGPFLGEQMTLFGNVASRAMDVLGYAVRGLKPVFDDLTFGLKAAWLIVQPFATEFKNAGKAILDAMIPAGTSVEGVRGPLQRLYTSVQENKLGLMEFARQGAGVMLTIAEGFIQYLPTIVGAFRTMAVVGLGALDALITGIAGTIGVIPGIGDRFTKAAADFGQFKDTFIAGLGTAQEKTQAFSNEVLPRLSQNRLKLDISSWEAQITTGKEQLKTVPPEKRAQLTAHIDQLEANVAQAKRDLKSIPDETVYLTLISRNLTDSSLNRSSIVNGVFTRSQGGIIRGPGTSTSDSIPSMLSDGEYVLKASAVDRLGVSNLDALNEGRALTAAGSSSVATMPAVAPARTVVGPTVNITIQGAIDPAATAQQLQRLLLKLKRQYGGPDLGFA
ncbi:hypothetical protein OHB39_06285 [Streptomyces sp. NBC_00047]|uniref:hypothetical protein n=1 Tax=Streptomyces sp. NBC_00047 TaxID=2975627 RepID=UPI0022586DB9|nr:hypothetical protein [Streptomyces sp. NBC_00047]MCX5607191.1 hypothetical protein [Streptomyces sp. NBC_00047]